MRPCRHPPPPCISICTWLWTTQSPQTRSELCSKSNTEVANPLDVITSAFTLLVNPSSPHTLPPAPHTHIHKLCQQTYFAFWSMVQFCLSSSTHTSQPLTQPRYSYQLDTIYCIQHSLEGAFPVTLVFVKFMLCTSVMKAPWRPEQSCGMLAVC